MQRIPQICKSKDDDKQREGVATGQAEEKQVKKPSVKKKILESDQENEDEDDMEVDKSKDNSKNNCNCNKQLPRN